MLDGVSILIVCPEGKSRDRLVARTLDLGPHPFCLTKCGEAQDVLGRQNFRVVLCSDTYLTAITGT